MNRAVLFFKRIFAFFMPGGLVFIAALVSIQQGFLDSWLPQIDGLLPYFILIIGFLLGWRFHRSRLAFVVLILMLTDRILYYLGPGGVISTGDERIIFHVAAILLPLNMALFYVLRERGIFTFTGLVRLVCILLQPLGIYYLLKKNPDIFKYLDHRFINVPWLDTLNMPQTVLIINGTLLLLFLGASLLSAKPIVRGFFWSFAAIATALYDINTDTGATLYLNVAGIIIILSVLETAYAMAFHDELTGLPDRRSLNTTMLGLGRRYTIAMLDIDFFKKFNDRYGHDVGDQVLCMVASHIRRVGGGGKPFRYGGEEFTVVFPRKTKKDVIPHLENLRESIAGAKFGLRDKKSRPKKRRKNQKRTTNPNTVSVTISIGAAEPGRSPTKPADVIKAADKALYRAKKKGRNCVVG